MWSGDGWVSGEYKWGSTQPIYTTDEWYSHESKSLKLPPLYSNTFLNWSHKDEGKSLELNISAKAKLMVDVYVSDSEKFSGIEVQLEIQPDIGQNLFYSDKITVPEGEKVTLTFDLETVKTVNNEKIPPELTILKVHWIKLTFNGIIDNNDSTDYADIYIDYMRCID